MTTSSGARSSSAGNGTTTQFTATFRAKEDSGVSVVVVDDTTHVVTAKVQDTDYTLARDADTGVPTVTFGTAPASGTTVIIYPTPTYSQAVAPTPGGPLFGSTVEGGYDALLALIQGLQDQINQCVRIPQADTAIAALAAANSRGDKLLAFDADGVPELVAKADYAN